MTTPAGVIRPTLLAVNSVNHKLPSGPAAIHEGELPGEMPAENSVTTPAGVIRATRLPSGSATHRLPSGPAAIPRGPLPGVMPAENSVTTPAGVIRPTRSAPRSVNHRLPSGPATIPHGAPPGVMPAENSVIVAAPPAPGAASATTAATTSASPSSRPWSRSAPNTASNIVPPSAGKGGAHRARAPIEPGPPNGMHARESFFQPWREVKLARARENSPRPPTSRDTEGHGRRAQPVGVEAAQLPRRFVPSRLPRKRVGIVHCTSRPR